MKAPTDLIAARVASLPITAGQRSEALAFVAMGESIAAVFLSMAKWLDSSPALKPSYQD